MTSQAGSGLLLVLVAIAGGCVTEIVPVEKTAVPGRTNSGVPLASGGPTGHPSSSGSSSTTRVAAAIRPLGSIPYDGLTLPLVTPDGRWLITQTGSIPQWESLLAEPGAVPPSSNDLRAFEITDAQLRAKDWAPSRNSTGELSGSATAGLLLGRCAGIDGQGTSATGWVLVERPNPDASRWIGKLSIQTGTVEWLVQGSAVNAQAILLRDGTLMYTRRMPNQAAAELVIRPPAGSQSVVQGESAQSADGNAAATPPQERVVRRDGWKFCQPITTPDQSMVAVLAIGPKDAQLLAYSTTQTDPSGAPLLIGKENMGLLGAAGAFQSVTAVEACPPPVDSPLRSSFLLMNADRQRLAVWDPTKASMSLLPASVAAGARVHSAVASGLVMASQKGMDFWAGTGFPARLVTGSYIPRTSTSDEGTRLICLSPQAGTAAPTLNVIAVQLVAPQP